MATVLNRTTGNSGSYPYNKDLRFSVNTVEFSDVDWIIEPDLTAVDGQPSKYWEISGDTVSLANTGRRNAIDADIAAQELAQSNQVQKDAYTDNELFRAQIKYVVDEINILRSNAGLTPARTYGGAQQYMFDAIDNGEV